MKAAQKSGSKLIIGQVVGVEFSPQDKQRIIGVKVEVGIMLESS